VDCKTQLQHAALTGYLGSDQDAWKQYDASVLLSSYKGPQLPVLIDTGTGDSFYKARSTPCARWNVVASTQQMQCSAVP
jgi:S-formylglutathione hydrolase